ncbi:MULTISPECIES: aromatic acid exporter family protein [unclassified Streptomyces]|uniref:FUSC family protein n=1 Tax=unclassified Streptomyces TaxID=2593676 RepID=UPI00331C6CED
MTAGTPTDRTAVRRTEAVVAAEGSVLRRSVEWFRRARDGAGEERHVLLTIGKSALAATVAWVLAKDVLHASSPAFAPFSAVLLMQVTIYRSLAQALRYVAAVTAGVLVQAALAFLAGPNLLTFVLVALIALTIGRWPALGSQGSQVATAAFFAFATFTTAGDERDTAVQVGQIILLVLLGSGVAVVVNSTIAPPLRYRSAEYGIRLLADAMSDLLDDMAPVLDRGEAEREETTRWRLRAEGIGDSIDRARTDLRTAEESLLYNPLRLFGRRRNRARARSSFHGYAAVLAALERALYQLASLIRSLDRWQQEEHDYSYGPFLERYGSFLNALAEITRILGQLDEDALGRQAKQLHGLVDQAEGCRREVAEEAERQALPLMDPARPYGVLVVEATRLMEELRHTTDVLLEYAEK